MNPPDAPQEPNVDPIGLTPAAGGGDGDDRKPASKRRTTAIAVAAAAVIAGAAAFGVHAASSSSAAATSTTATASANGSGFRGSANPRGFGRGTVGTIGAVNGSTLSVKAGDGTTTTVQTTDSTTVTKSVSSSVSAIKVGDNLTVIGTGTTANVAAQNITDTGTTAATQAPGRSTPPGGGSGARGTRDFTAAHGSVKSINGSTITLTTSSGATVTVTTSSTTKVTTSTTSTVSALAVGDRVSVTGASSNGTVTATAIREGSAGFGGNGSGFPGGGAPPSSSNA